MFTMRNKTLYSKLPVYGGKFTIKYKVNLPEIIDHGGSLLNTTPAVCMIIYVWVFPDCSTCLTYISQKSKQVTKTADQTKSKPVPLSSILGS